MFDVITNEEVSELKQVARRYFHMLRTYQNFLNSDAEDKPPHPIYIKRTFHMSFPQFYEIRRQFDGMNEEQITEKLVLNASLEQLKSKKREVQRLKVIQHAYFEACPSEIKRRYDAAAIGEIYGFTKKEKQKYFNVKSLKNGDLTPNDHKNILIAESIALLIKAQPQIKFDELFKLTTQIVNEKLDKRRVRSIYEKLNSNTE